MPYIICISSQIKESQETNLPYSIEYSKEKSYPYNVQKTLYSVMKTPVVEWIMIFLWSYLACQEVPSEPSPPKPSVGLPNPTPNGYFEEIPEPDLDAPSLGCLYSVQNVRPEWTAYKYTEKSPVQGHFERFQLSKKSKSPSIAKALKGISIVIDTSSVQSNNQARNKTISERFFNVFDVKPEIKGTILSVHGDEQQGTLIILLEMNNKKKSYRFAYKQTESVITADSVMDMMDFGLNAPFASIHSSCKDVHTGSDGVAKTWTEVALRAVIEYKKECP